MVKAKQEAVRLMGADLAREQLSFWRIVDVPFETLAAALDSMPQTGEVRFGRSEVRGPGESDDQTGTRRLQVRLGRGPLRPVLPMRLEIDRWSDTATAVELVPSRPVRPSEAYFEAGHHFLDTLTRSLVQLAV